MNRSLTIAILDQNLKGPTATFDEQGLSAVRWAWEEVKATLGPECDFHHAMTTAKIGLETWKAKPHNARWWRRIDGTPIPNDLLVNIAEAFVEALRAPTASPADAHVEVPGNPSKPAPVPSLILSVGREEVARIIDHHAFLPLGEFCRWRWGSAFTSENESSGQVIQRQWRNAALTKADAIIALWSSIGEGDQEVRSSVAESALTVHAASTETEGH